jgi:hypothetical protein
MEIYGQEIRMKNVVVSGNTRGGQTANCYTRDPDTYIVSHGHNLFGDLNNCPVQSVENPGTDITGVANARLSELLDWGGFAPVHVPLPGSPAIDAGDCFDIFGNPILTDQRGYARPFGAGCDIGAAERQEVETDIEDEEVDIVSVPYLAQNYPNPFARRTVIGYRLPSTSRVTLKIYNVAGQLVRTLIDKEEPAGEKSAVWDGKTDTGEEVSSGLYFYRLEANDPSTGSGQGFVDQKRMLLLK